MCSWTSKSRTHTLRSRARRILRRRREGAKQREGFPSRRWRKDPWRGNQGSGFSCVQHFVGRILDLCLFSDVPSAAFGGFQKSGDFTIALALDSGFQMAETRIGRYRFWDAGQRWRKGVEVSLDLVCVRLTGTELSVSFCHMLSLCLHSSVQACPSLRIFLDSADH